MKKNIWYPGDIITTEKWNKIINNATILAAYKLPTLFTENVVTINKSYNEIVNLLNQGVICWLISPFGENSYDIELINFVDPINKVIGINFGEYIFHIDPEDPTKMTPAGEISTTPIK